MVASLKIYLRKTHTSWETLAKKKKSAAQLNQFKFKRVQWQGGRAEAMPRLVTMVRMRKGNMTRTRKGVKERIAKGDPRWQLPCCVGLPKQRIAARRSVADGDRRGQEAEAKWGVCGFRIWANGGDRPVATIYIHSLPTVGGRGALIGWASIRPAQNWVVPRAKLHILLATKAQPDCLSRAWERGIPDWAKLMLAFFGLGLVSPNRRRMVHLAIYISWLQNFPSQHKQVHKLWCSLKWKSWFSFYQSFLIKWLLISFKISSMIFSRVWNSRSIIIRRH